MKNRKDRIAQTRELQDNLLDLLSRNRADSEIDIHNYLGKAFDFGDFFYYIYDVSGRQFDHVSEGIKPVLGIDPEQLDPVYFKNKMHPSDFESYLEMEAVAARFLFNSEPDQQLNYRLRYDCRVLHSAGDYVRILHQILPIKSSKAGVPFRIFGIFTDISHLKMDGEISFSLIGLNGAPTYLSIDSLKNRISSENVLSKRETEILMMLSEDMISKEIAEKLFISPQTVANHRKNMLKKTRSKSTIELMMKAIRNGWI